MMRVTDPLIELLAIKLYEHDTQGGGAFRYWPWLKTERILCWAAVAEEDRELYRMIARGELDYGRERATKAPAVGSGEGS